MTKPTVETLKSEGINKLKLAKDVAVALAPAVITAVTCAIIVKKLDKE